MTKDDVKYTAKKILPLFIIWEGGYLLMGLIQHNLLVHIPQMVAWFFLLFFGFFGFLFSHMVKKNAKRAGRGAKITAMLQSLVCTIPLFIGITIGTVVQGRLENIIWKAEVSFFEAGDIVVYAVMCIIFGACFWAWFAFVEEE